MKQSKENNENQINQDQKMSFNEYKIEATKEDIKKFEKKMVPFWWENIPLLGCLVYIQRMKINYKDIDRGILVKEITKYSMIFLFSTLIVFYGIFSIITPWFLYWNYSVAIKKTKEKLANNEI